MTISATSGGSAAQPNLPGDKPAILQLGPLYQPAQQRVEQLFRVHKYWLADAAGRSAMLAGEAIDLTTAEFDLLWLLTSNAGRILSREEIFNALRGIEYDGQDRSIDVRISRIRPKIGDDPMHPRLIKTVRSKGYLFVAEAAEAMV